MTNNQHPNSAPQRVNKHLPNYVKAGIFAAVAITLFVFSIFFLGSDREVFANQKEFYTTFQDVKGLSSGAPVRLGGIIIGKVDDITFQTQGENTHQGDILVKLAINEKFLDKIRTDSRITLETQGLLGDKFINISPGKEETKIPAGSFIAVGPQTDIGELMGKAGTIVENLVSVSEDLKGVSKALGGESGDDIKQTITEFTKLTKNINAIADAVKNGDGLLHGIIFESSGKATTGNINTVTENLVSSSAQLDKILKDAASGDGLIKDLISKPSKDQKGLNDVVQNLNAASENLKVATQSLKDGKGTLGALLQDSTLYDKMIELTGGAQRSLILRTAINHALELSQKDKK